MKWVSWVVVGVSLVWLLAGSFGLRISQLDWSVIPPRQVTGTITNKPGGTAHTNLLAESYTQAWNDGRARDVATLYSSEVVILGKASLSAPRQDIESMAQNLMTDVSGLQLTMLDFKAVDDQWLYSWQLTGFDVDTGQAINLQGKESWHLDNFGLIHRVGGQPIMVSQPN